MIRRHIIPPRKILSQFMPTGLSAIVTMTPQSRKSGYRDQLSAATLPVIRETRLCLLENSALK